MPDPKGCAGPEVERRQPVLLDLFYFAFYAVGVCLPSLGLYTRGLGFTSLQIGFIVALTPLSKIILPPL